jgi:hypothetical protein
VDLLRVAAEVAAILAVAVPSALWARKKIGDYLQAQRQERKATEAGA